MGSRSALIVLPRAGNRAHRDPKEGRGASRGENQGWDTREGTMDPANLLTKRHWIVELARRKPGQVLYSLNCGFRGIADRIPTQAGQRSDDCGRPLRAG